MASVRHLVQVLTQCVPQLDSEPLLAELPKSANAHGVAHWLVEHLETQGLMKRWSRATYHGEIPELAPLAGFDLSDYDRNFMRTFIKRAAQAGVELEVPLDVPYISFLNNTLKPHGIRLVELGPFETAFTFCVLDNADLLDALDEALSAFDLCLIYHDPLSKDDVLELIET